MGQGVSDADAVEQCRHRCEVRELLRFGMDRSHQYVDGRILKIEEARGADAANRLRADYKAQWRAGNRGEFGDWRELGLK